MKNLLKWDINRYKLYKYIFPGFNEKGNSNRCDLNLVIASAFKIRNTAVISNLKKNLSQNKVSRFLPDI